jgi:hypothetical protein
LPCKFFLSYICCHIHALFSLSYNCNALSIHNLILLLIIFHRLVADNFDLSIKSRIQSSVNQSIHWTHQYAIKDFDSSAVRQNPSFRIDELPLQNLLPTAQVQMAFKYDCAVHVSRIICKYIPAFKTLQDVVVRHIPHPFMKEMSSKSDMVCVFVFA